MKLPPAHKNRSLICGACVSFKKCKSKNSIHELSRACEKYSDNKGNSEISEVRNSNFFIKLRVKIKEIKIKKDIEKEMESMSSSLKSKSVNPRFDNPNRDMTNLAIVLEKNQSYRDRINEIIITISTLLNGSKGLYYIQTLAIGKINESHSYVFKNAKNASDRDTIISSILKELEAKINKCTNIIDIGDRIIKNLDQTHWTIRTIVGIGEDIIENRNLTSGRKK